MTVNIGYDFEFIEHEVLVNSADGGQRKVMTIEPISIGMKVYRGGPSYYAVFRDAPWADISRSPWLMDNVVPKLPQFEGQLEFDAAPGSQLVNLRHPDVKPRQQIASEVSAFLLGALQAAPQFTFPTLELWADYCAFDHVSLAWLWGTMVNLPEHVPMRTNDLMQLAATCGVSESQLPQGEADKVHHAGYDAAQGEEMFNYCMQAIERGGTE